MQVRHVAGMVAVSRHQTVLLAIGVEMAAGRLERRIAPADRVDVKCMIARRNTCEGDAQQDAARGLGQIDRADVLAVSVLEHCFRGLRLRLSAGQGCDRETGGRYGTSRILHRWILHLIELL
jgi:hypothetical protein